MPVHPNSPIEITGFQWVPPFAEGLVRDLRVRWALEEAGLDYRARLLIQDRPPEYLLEQPFNQVPTYRDGDVHIFESAAIVQHIGEKSEALLPREPQPRWRAIQWTYAAVNSVEPALQNFFLAEVIYGQEEWARLRRPGAEEFARLKLKRVADWLGDREWLEDRFTIGDLLMIAVLRIIERTSIGLPHPNIEAYVRRGEARPAFQQALADHLAPFRANQVQGEAA